MDAATQVNYPHIELKFFNMASLSGYPFPVGGNISVQIQWIPSEWCKPSLTSAPYGESVVKQNLSFLFR